MRVPRIYRPCPLAIAAALLPLLIVVFLDPPHAAKPESKKKAAPDTTTYTPLTLESERYDFRYPTRTNDCLGEDDELDWKAAGDLKPGESFSFTPRYAGCQYHPAAITVSLTWQGSRLELSGIVPDNDSTSQDPAQKGQVIVAPTIGSTAQLCMFPYYQSGDRFYTITVANVGSEMASGILLEGYSDNDWIIHFHNRCLKADADNDGWNDSLEHGMALLLKPITDIGGIYQPPVLWGSNYLGAVAATNAANDEVDRTPVDFNDDGKVDSLDVTEGSRFVGEGNGITQEQITPTPGEATYTDNNAYEWRRYDLDGDGYVAQTDIDIVRTLIDAPLPMVDDIVAPTGRILFTQNGDTVARGTYFQIRGHVWDNAAIARVEYLVNGRVECTITDSIPNLGLVSPFYYCWWEVPKRRGPYELAIRIEDASGNVTTTESISVNVD